MTLYSTLKTTGETAIRLLLVGSPHDLKYQFDKSVWISVSTKLELLTPAGPRNTGGLSSRATPTLLV